MRKLRLASELIFQIPFSKEKSWEKIQIQLLHSNYYVLSCLPVWPSCILHSLVCD